MKRILFCLPVFFGLGFASCKKNGVVPVSGTIAGKPAVSLYGNSNNAADYLLIDTAAADMKILYDGIVFPYHYTTPGIIYMVYNNIPAVQASVSASGSNLVLTIVRVYNTVTFGSTVYTSK